MAKEPFFERLRPVATTKLNFDSSPLPKKRSADLIAAMPGNNDEAPPCHDNSSGIETLAEATRTVRDLLAGRSQQTEILSSKDPSIRKTIAAELFATLSRANIEETEHARRLILDNAYLDDAMQELGTAELPNERAMAARALGLIGNPRGIVSLVNALLDDASEVRFAAEQALSQISGPVVFDIGSLLERELNIEAAKVRESFSAHKDPSFQETVFQNLAIEEQRLEKPMNQATEVTASSITPEEQVVQKAMRELKHRLFDAEDLTWKRTALVQKAIGELEQQLLEAEELTRKRIELEAAKRAEEHAARCAEAEQTLRELEEKREKELALLHHEVEEFQQDLEVVAQQRTEVEQQHLETRAQIQKFDKEKAELVAALEARKAEDKRQLSEAENRSRTEVEQVRLKTQAQIQSFDKERTELVAAVEARKAEVESTRIEAKRQLSEAENRSRTEVEQLRLVTQAQIQQLDKEKAERVAAAEAKKAEIECLRSELERQL
ncbi:MAG TPA: HEAT repeat domain-containing protein, partial [Pyrinomonadaceae bacterium]